MTNGSFSEAVRRAQSVPLPIRAQADAHAVRVTPEPKSPTSAGQNRMNGSAVSQLQISAQADAHAVRVTPEPKQAAMRGDDRMSGSADHRLQISAQADAHEVRVMPEPRTTRDTRRDGVATGKVLGGFLAKRDAARGCRA